MTACITFVFKLEKERKLFLEFLFKTKLLLKLEA